MAGQILARANLGLFTRAGSYDEVHRVDFRSAGSNQLMTLTVRKHVASRARLRQIGLATHTFTFEPSRSRTREATPISDGSPLDSLEEQGQAVDDEPPLLVQQAGAIASPAASSSWAREPGEVGTGVTGHDGSDTIVLIHDRYNGSKKIFVNGNLVYSIRWELTDGCMNSWVIPLWFGDVILQLTSKFLSSSGFVYKLSLKDGEILYEAS